MRMRNLCVAAVAAATALIGGAAAPAGAAVPPPLVDGLIGPLAVEVMADGQALVGQSFAGIASTVSRQGVVTDLFQEDFLGGIEEGPGGSILYMVGSEDGQSSWLKARLPNGTTRVIADVGAHERTNNPDAVNTYGFQDIPQECADQLPPEFGPPWYNGIVETNPYKLLHSSLGTFLADSAANAIFRIQNNGQVSTVGVLPPQPYTFPEDVSRWGLPECIGGRTFLFEPVPTDVEQWGNDLLVTTLPGGPESPALGARGSVYKLDPRTGAFTMLHTGFLGATDLAVNGAGHIAVTEIFAGKVTKVAPGGARSTVVEIPEPAAIEWSNGRWVVTYDVFASGKLGIFPG